MVKRAKIEVRIANNDEGKFIADLCKNMGFLGLDDLNWHNIYPHWLVAEMEGSIVGALEVLVGRPIGRAEFLCVSQELNQIEKARISQMLLINAMATLKLSGAETMMCIIPFSNKQLKRMVKNRGGTVCASGNMLTKRIA
jgi:hypothetical protein